MKLMRGNRVWINEKSELLIINKNARYTVTQVPHEKTLQWPSGDGFWGQPHSIPPLPVSIGGRLSPVLVRHLPMTQCVHDQLTQSIKIQHGVVILREASAWRDQICLIYPGDMIEPNKFSFPGKLRVIVPEIPLLLHMNQGKAGFSGVKCTCYFP